MTDREEQFRQMMHQVTVVHTIVQASLAQTIADCIGMPRGIPSVEWFLGRLDRNVQERVRRNPFPLTSQYETMLHTQIEGVGILIRDFYDVIKDS